MKFFSRVNTSIALFMSEARLCGLFVYFVAFSGRFPYYPKEHLINHSPRYSLCIAELFSSGITFENNDLLAVFLSRLTSIMIG